MSEYHLSLPMKLALHGIMALETYTDELVLIGTLLGDAAGETITLSHMQKLADVGLLQSKSGTTTHWTPQTPIMLTIQGWKIAKVYKAEIEQHWLQFKQLQFQNNKRRGR